jgi:hypothetical protein
VSDEPCCAICHSLKKHHELEVLDISATYHDAATAPVIAARVQALLGIVGVNMSLFVIACMHELYQESITPYLVTKRFRPLVNSIQKTRRCFY